MGGEGWRERGREESGEVRRREVERKFLTCTNEHLCKLPVVTVILCVPPSVMNGSDPVSLAAEKAAKLVKLPEGNHP